MATFKSLTLDPRPVDAMSRAQISLILGLETILMHGGLILTCPTCAREGHSELVTDNSLEDDVWKIDCHCRRRRVHRLESQPMAPTGDLLLLVTDLLAPLGLDVRCPSGRCVMTPLDIRQTPEGLIVQCRCGGKFHFKKTGAPTRPH